MAAQAFVSQEVEDYQAPVSVWGLIQEHVHHTLEQQEVKRIVGESLVDQSLELQQEVATLLSIWEEMRVKPGDRRSVLPEPPHQRERLVQEICFFVESVRDKAQQQGLDAERLLSRHKSSVIDYAIDSSRASSSLTDRSSSSLSIRRSPDIRDAFVNGDLQSMSDKFNYLQLDDVLQNLRNYIEDEIASLLRDITFLQHCLDNEMQQQSVPREFSNFEPSLAELKEERAALEKELLAPEASISIAKLTQKSLFRPKTPLKQPGSVVGQWNTSERKAPSGTVPVKAIHDLDVSPSTQTDAYKLGYRSHSQISLQDIAIVEKPAGRRTVSPSRVKVVSVGNILSSQERDSTCVFAPSPPPPSIVPHRPSSADRFRKRVLDCRDAS